MPTHLVTSALAGSLLAGKPSVDELVARTSRTLGRSWRWLRPLAQRYVKAFSNGVRPRHRDVVQFLSQDAGFLRALDKYADKIRIEQWLNPPHSMQPVSAAGTWPVPAIETIGDLADWLAVTPNELDWSADLKALGYKGPSTRLRHYSYRILRKSSGAIRLIEAPKGRLKEMQRQILSQILDKIPPHPAAHGFIKGRSIKTFTTPHLAQTVVLRMDLSDFFPSFCGARIQTIFRTIGYPETVADLLGGICTNAVPRDVWKDSPPSLDPLILQEARGLYARPHLPQGAPTSPALANIGTYRGRLPPHRARPYRRSHLYTIRRRSCFLRRGALRRERGALLRPRGRHSH
ncbi:MAG TPA: reverse transcriptase family protein [Bryobacteraceae bacterium]|nr:reverse transcriptase family protein [Bryobacteraceae bacterium]